MLLTTTARQQHAAKVSTMVRWLSTWRYSSPTVLARLLRLKHVHHLTPLLNSLEERDALVRYVGFRAYPRIPLYTLAPGCTGLFPSEEVRPPMSRAHFERVRRSPIVHHDLSLQFYVAGVDQPLAVRPGSRDAAAITPDALLAAPAGTTALELEQTVKSPPRIFRALVAHAEAFERGEYTAVRYVFPTADKKALYVERFNHIVWPRFHYFADTKRYASVGDPLIVANDDPIRSRFHFEVSPLWPSLI